MNNVLNLGANHQIIELSIKLLAATRNKDESMSVEEVESRLNAMYSIVEKLYFNNKD